MAERSSKSLKGGKVKLTAKEKAQAKAESELPGKKEGTYLLCGLAALAVSVYTLYSQADLDWTDKTSRSSVEMNDRSFRPAFIKDLKNHDDYDVIYIGFPIWWYTAPTIINSFVEEYGFAGKKVVMFATSGGSTPEKALKEFKAAYPEIDWVEAKLLNGATEESIKKWIDEK